MTPKEIKKMITKRNERYAYYSKELEVFCFFSKDMESDHMS